MTRSSLRLADLVKKYYASADFRALKPRTQYMKRKILERMLNEPIGPTSHNTIGSLPAVLPPKVIRKLRDRRTDLIEIANHRLKALRALFKWATEEELISVNPARDVPYLSNKSGGYHSWTDEEVARYEQRWPLGTPQRVALAVLLYTGLRRGDAIRVGDHMVRDGWLTLTMEKTEMPIQIPVLPDLQAVLDAGPVGKETWISGDRGVPLKSSSFGNCFRVWCNAAGLPHCSAHGLRKAGACRMAEQGATEQQLMAIFGWQTSREAVLYTKAANRKMMAAQAVGMLSRNKVVARPPKTTS